jgi:hypothetical protein
MRRYIAGWLVSALVVGLAANCSSKKDDDEGGGGTGGIQLAEAGPDTGSDAPYTPCENIIGLDMRQCQASSQEAQPLEVDMLVVMDASGSMREAPTGYTMSKWEAVRTALSAAMTEVQGAVAFGLEFFPSSATGVAIPSNCAPGGGAPDRCCEMPAGAEMSVPIALGSDTVNQIISELQVNSPSGGTPTAVALQRAYDYFASPAGQALTGGKYVLLATDGGPNCNPGITCDTATCTLNLDGTSGCPIDGFSCCGSRPEGCLDDAATVQKITALRTDLGVTTIVVGIPGSELYEANLNAFAEAGGAALTGGATSYYRVSAEGGVAELTQTFQTITTQLVTSCRLPLDIDLAVVNLNEVNVAVDCNLVYYSAAAPTDTTQSWWYYDNVDAPSEIIIDGPKCAEIQAGVNRIDAIFGCATAEIY